MALPKQQHTLNHRQTYGQVQTDRHRHLFTTLRFRHLPTSPPIPYPPWPQTLASQLLHRTTPRGSPNSAQSHTHTRHSQPADFADSALDPATTGKDRVLSACQCLPVAACPRSPSFRPVQSKPTPHPHATPRPLPLARGLALALPTHSDGIPSPIANHQSGPSSQRTPSSPANSNSNPSAAISQHQSTKLAIGSPFDQVLFSSIFDFIFRPLPSRINVDRHIRQSPPIHLPLRYQPTFSSRHPPNLHHNTECTRRLVAVRVSVALARRGTSI